MIQVFFSMEDLKKRTFEIVITLLLMCITGLCTVIYNEVQDNKRQIEHLKDEMIEYIFNR